jgi:YbbR domain-containing protein
MGKNTKILILSFIFAFALWLYINLNLSYSLDLSIPVEVQSSKLQALSGEIPNSIDVTVKGKGWDLINILISKNLKYNLDISRFKKDSRIITEQFVNERLNLNPNVTILKITPDTINIDFDKIYEKLVPVKNNIVVNLKEGYSIVGKPVLNPDSVKIQGASSLVNKIKSFPTETRVFNDVNSNLGGVVNLKDTLSNLIKLEVKQVSFNYNIQLSAEKNFDDIVVDIINAPEDKEVLLIPSKVNVSVRGGVEKLAQISSSDIIVSIEFEKIENDTLGYVIPDVKIPAETNLLKIDPQKLQYIIKKKLQ